MRGSLWVEIGFVFSNTRLVLGVGWGAIPDESGLRFASRGESGVGEFWFQRRSLWLFDVIRLRRYYSIAWRSSFALPNASARGRHPLKVGVKWWRHAAHAFYLILHFYVSLRGGGQAAGKTTPLNRLRHASRAFEVIWPSING